VRLPLSIDFGRAGPAR